MSKSGPEPSHFDEWEVEDAARTLTRAEEIKANASLHKKALVKIKATANAANAVLGQKVPSIHKPVKASNTPNHLKMMKQMGIK